MKQSTFPRSGVLVLGLNSIQSLLPSTLISQAESLLDSHRIQDAVDLADQQRKRLQTKLVVDEDEADELRYVYQRIGFQCLTETLFEDAGKNLLAGDLDPRILISYFPDLRGSLFNETDTLDVFAGIAERMPMEHSIDDIVRNYSPHLAPNTRSAPPTAELRNILGMAARDMLEVFLRKHRVRRKVSNNVDVSERMKRVNEAVDTVLARLLAESEKTADLYSLLQESNDVLLSEIEPVLKRTGQYSALCTIYRRTGDDLRLLETWSRLVDGEWTDEDIPDPLSDMFTLLSEKKDNVLTRRWGIWLTTRDPDRALKLLTSGKRREKTEDEYGLLRQIQEANPVAGVQYLQYLVLQKRSTKQDLHMQLASSYIDELLDCLNDEATSKLWRAKSSSYASSRNETSFLSYFASTTPESEHKRVRLKTVIFLQGSVLYDATVIRSRLQEHKKILHLELAIVEGKLGNHHEALTVLVHELHDATSAEAYCTLGGEVVPVKTAQTVGEKYGLQEWSGALFSSSSKSTSAMERQKSVSDEVKKELLRVLLEVYMSGGESTAERTAHLLNAQAMNLEVIDVISLVPPDWPLSAMSSFLARSFRRTLHARHEGHIMKALSMGQNLETIDHTWPILREQGAIVEEAVDGDEDEDDDGFDEKEALVEKFGLHMQDTALLPSERTLPVDIIHTHTPG